MSTIKQILHAQCLDFIEDRLQIVQQTINDIQKSLLSETKSSAGDKHETGRAMLQLEREKAGQQLSEIQKTKKLLSKVRTEDNSKIAHLGSVVYTTKANYYLAISAGAINFKNDTFFAISPNTPIGKLLLGKTIGDEICFRENIFKIKRVL